MRFLRVRWLLIYLLVVAVTVVGVVFILKERLADDYLREGHRLAAQGSPREALGDFTLAMLLAPERSAPYLARAQAYRALDMHARAVADLSAAIARAPGQAELHRLRADLLAGPLKRHRQAIHDLDALLRLRPDDAQAYYRRGAAYDHVNNPHKAVKDLTRALQLDPQLAEAYRLRADIRERFRDRPRQIADLTALLQLQPDDTDAYRRRGEAHLALQEFAQARADFDRVLAAEPTAQGFFKRGTAQLNLKQFRAAVADFSRALELHRYSISAYYNRARAYAALGQTERARRDWATVCELQAGGQSEACLQARTGG